MGIILRSLTASLLKFMGLFSIFVDFNNTVVLTNKEYKNT